jgi:hypothetical protein
LARYVEAHAAWKAGNLSPSLLRSTRKAAAELDAVSWSTAALDLRLLAARIATSLGHLEIARTELRAAARARSSAQLERRARAWHALALLRVQEGDRRGAFAAVSAGLTAAERVRALLGSTELRVMVASHVSELASLGIKLAVEDKVADRVLWSAERHRAATLRIRPALPSADENLAALRAQLRAVAGEAERAQLAGVPLHALNRRRHALEEQLRQRLRHHGIRSSEVSRSGSMLEPAPVRSGSAAGLVRTLSGALDGAALIEYVECGGMLYAIVVSGAGMPRSDASEGTNLANSSSREARPGNSRQERSGRTSRPSLHALGPVKHLLDDLDALRFAWRRLLTRHGSESSLEAAALLAMHAAEQLDRALLAPLAPLLADRRLVIVPPGPLQSLPWPMLPSCAGRTITVAPSASTWLTARPAAPPAMPAPPSQPDMHLAAGTRHRVVLVAGPGLPEATAEVGSLATLYPDAEVLTGLDATVAKTLRALDGADIAHIAAHGRFRADNPMFSSLVLADGPLTVYDLERLHRAPKTIMLAACDTALTATHPGDEVTGLASALLAVGASSVVAPLLPLPDEVAARLAHGWHRRLGAGQSPAQALSAMTTAITEEGPLSRLAASSLVCLGG